MNDTIIKFTEFSKNPNSYEQIHANLRVPYTQYSTLIIDSLTTNACFEVLNANDYLKFDVAGTVKTLTFDEPYSDLNAESFATLLDEKLKPDNIGCSVDYTNRIRFNYESDFSLIDASYNVKTLLGIFDETLPINSINGVIQCSAVGQYLSTSILYLIGSIGGKCYIKENEGYKNQRVLMRINNSFSANFPVIANNAEFKVYTLSNDLSNIDFELVDARFKPVKLLCPMYLCGTVIGNVEAETLWTGMMIPQELIQEKNEVLSKAKQDEETKIN